MCELENLINKLWKLGNRKKYCFIIFFLCRHFSYGDHWKRLVASSTLTVVGQLTYGRQVFKNLAGRCVTVCGQVVWRICGQVVWRICGQVVNLYLDETIYQNSKSDQISFLAKYFFLSFHI